MNNNDIEILDNNIDNSNSSESNNMNNKPKKSKKGLIVIILLLLIIAGLCTFIYMKKDVLFNSGNNSNNTNENNNTNNTVESIEEELTDQDLKKRITNKVSLIIPSEENGSGFWFFKFKDTILNKEVVLSDEDKLRLALGQHYGEEYRFKIGQANNDKFKEIYINDLDSEEIGYKRQIIEIEKDYFYLFGKTIPKYYEELPGCPHYFYDNVDKFYFSIHSCGTGIGFGTLTYVNKITQKDDEIYIYISAEYYEYNENNKLIIYSDHNKTNVVQGDEINSSNYDKFSEYKLTFTKDGNDYYYKSIERTK